MIIYQFMLGSGNANGFALLIQDGDKFGRKVKTGRGTEIYLSWKNYTDWLMVGSLVKNKFKLELVYGN